MSPELAREILSLAAPPVAGALVGWAAAVIVTGALPRALAGAGVMPQLASRALNALRSEAGRARTTAVVSAAISALLQTPLGKLRPQAPVPGSPSVEQALGDVLRGWLGSRWAIHSVRQLLSRGVTLLSALRVGELAEKYHLQSFIAERLLPLLAGREVRDKIALAAGAILRKGFPAAGGARGALEGALAPLLPKGVDRLMEWLRSEGMRAELTQRGRTLLASTLERLNVLQRFLLSAGQFDRRLEEKMPEIVEDALASLESMARTPDIQKRFLAVILSAAGDGKEGSPPSGAEEAAAAAVRGLLSRLEDSGERREIARRLEDAVREAAGPTLGTAARRILGVDEGQLVERLGVLVLERLSRQETASGIAREITLLAGRFAEENADIPLGVLLRMDGPRKQQADASLSAAAGAILEEKLPLILAAFNGEALARRAAVAVRGWAGVFGAGLGFLVGLVPAALRVLGVS